MSSDNSTVSAVTQQDSFTESSAMQHDNFTVSTAAQQNFDCDKLCKFIHYINRSCQKLQSMIILRNGCLVMDMHLFPFQNSIPRYINCCTESIISILVGIAIGEGIIKDVKEKVLDFFPEYNPSFTPDSKEELKKDITLEHLFTMTDGIEWNDTRVVFGENSYDSRMHGSEDPVKFILEQPMREEPGKRYNHCLGAIHLLSAILTRASGMSVLEYARIKLFHPLGITECEWITDKNGICSANGLSVSVYALARLGQLLLQRGSWEGTQIVPAEWISLSTRKHFNTSEGPWSYYGCGYQWNVNKFGGYSSKGVGGQYLAVIPKHNLVVVMLSALPLDQFYWHETLIETFIIPATKVPIDRLTNLQNQAILSQMLEEYNRVPSPKPVCKLPRLTAKISGKEYVFCPEAYINQISLCFNSKDECCIKILENDSFREVLTGLDEVYRVTGVEASKGFWENDYTFVVNIYHLQFSYEMILRFIFEDNKLILESASPDGGFHDKLEGYLL